MAEGSWINKLQIRGIRSFGPAPESIEFFRPLTLIVGLNGSGKTTIIECLKYATTGDLPPNSKGGAFIHDPQLVGEKEVLAQVRLRFFAAGGARMDATRNMQLTVKKATRQLKTLESHLYVNRNGERAAISSRVAELDAMIPMYLGVSKAILDNVIFCHQEESLWPMSEPSVLKKKFDEIFEALKYTKAIDNIKVLRKKQNEELGKLKIIEENSREDKLRGEKAEKRMEVLRDEIEDLRKDIKRSQRQMEEASRESDAAWDHASTYVSKVEELKGKQESQRSKQEILDDLRKHMTPMDDSDDRLRTMNDTYEQTMEQYRKDLESRTSQWKELQEQIEQGRNEEGNKKTDQGRLQAEKSNYDNQLGNRERLVKDTARSLNIRGYDGDLDNEKVQDFVDRIAKMAKDQNAALDRAKRETHEELGKVQKGLDSLAERKTKLNSDKDNAKQQVRNNENRMTDLRKTADRLDVDVGRQASAESEIGDIESKLNNSKATSSSSSWDKKIRDAENKVSDYDEKADELSNELIQATNHAGETARADHLKQELKKAQSSLQTSKGAHSDRLSQILGKSWNEKTIEGLYQDALTSAVSALTGGEQQRDGTSREMEQVAFKLKVSLNELKQKKEERDRNAKKVCEAIGDDDPAVFPEALETIEYGRNQLAKDISNSEQLGQYYRDCSQTLKDNDVCRLCERAMKDDRERTRLQKKLDKYMKEAQKQAWVEELKETEVELKNVKNVQSAYDRWDRLQKVEIAEGDREVQRLQPSYDSLLATVEEQDGTVSERQSAKADVESLLKTVQTISKYVGDIKRHESELAEFSGKPSQAGLGRGLEEVRSEHKEAQDQSRSAQALVKRLQADRERANANINNLELTLRDARSKLDQVRHQLKEKNNITSQVADLSASNDEQRSNVRRTDSDLQGLVPQISQTEAKLDDIRQRRDSKERDLRDEASMLANTRDKLELADRDIHAYLDKNGPAQLARHERDIKTLREKITQLEGEQRQLTTNINKLQKQQANHEETKRQIVDNLRYRHHLHELEGLRTAIMSLEAEGAEADRDHYQREAQKWQAQRTKLSADEASLMGQMKSKDNEIARLLSDWETDYSNAAYKFKEAHIRVEATKAAVDDLGRYGGALDKAIMKYHALKMEQINRIIEELWRRTYQGTDVDTVLIRSDNEANKGNKSYNYRVCMVKQDAEMDMRGRCSAGQKVLASIIIRLALAECFGVNCGLIALDEPTTNLDRDNIRALAESLHFIIKSRERQRNFQLIVITHDEAFLRDMHCADHADAYYRVGRGPDQRSVIKKQSIADVM